MSSDDEVRELFNELDADHSGALDINEVWTLMKKLGHRLNNKQLARCFREIDTDASGAVDYEVRNTISAT
eukprot:SAG11_NODE_2039_length_3892_cov_1.839705_5_plen_70_part_00